MAKELDTVSVIIGQLQKSVENLEKNHIKDTDAMFVELREIKAEQKATNEHLGNQKVKVGTLSAVVSLLVAYFMSFIKGGGSS